MKISRREFGKKVGGLGIAATLAAAGYGASAEERAASEAQLEKRKPGDRPKLRRLGRTGLMLLPVGFGAQNTRDPDLIRYALDQGMNLIETSWTYGFGKKGNSCECIGKAIGGKRDSVCLAVAYETAFPPESRSWLSKQFEQTLSDLGTDHIDIFLWHHPSMAKTLKENQAIVASGERVDLMLKWKAEGKFRWCGVTTHSEQKEWLEFMSASKLYDVAVVAFNYKSPKQVVEAVQEASRNGIGLIAMKTQSPNYLNLSIGDAPDHRAALNWVLSKDYITAAIPGMTTRDQVDQNLAVMRAIA